ncbi:hypothetical protein B566_EDAN016636 [Ephemera danica]|nr:hypothetical protein B566_EDAN016636 [Ephemera danica]
MVLFYSETIWRNFTWTHLVPVLLLCDEVRTEGRQREHGSLLLHVVHPGGETGVGLVEVLGQRQCLLEAAQTVRAERRHGVHGLAEVLSLLANGRGVVALAGLAQHFLGSAQNVSHATFLTRDVVVESLVLLQLHANDVRIGARWFCFPDLTLNLAEPVQQLVDVADNLHRALQGSSYLLGELNALRLALDLLTDGVEASVVSRDEALDGGSAFSRRQLAQLRTHHVDGVQHGPVLSNVGLQAPDLFLLAVTEHGAAAARAET